MAELESRKRTEWWVIRSDRPKRHDGKKNYCGFGVLAKKRTGASAKKRRTGGEANPSISGNPPPPPPTKPPPTKKRKKFPGGY